MFQGGAVSTGIDEVTVTTEVETAVHQTQQLLQQGDLAGAERVLAPLFARGLAGDPAVLQLAGLIRLQQGRLAEAEVIFAQGRLTDPRDPWLAYYHGASLGMLKRGEDAVGAYRAAIALKPDLAEARLAVSVLLIESGQMAQAESVARGGLGLGKDDRLKGMMHNNLGLALRAQRKPQEALENFEKAQHLNPAIPKLDILRAEILQELRRPDEAAAVFEKSLVADPANPALHRAYNELLYRMDRTDDALSSYGRAPKTRELQLDKASFLNQENRGEEAYSLYRDVMAANPGDVVAAAGAASTLTMLERYDEAAAAFDAILSIHCDPDLLSSAAEVALLRQDPQKALALCRQALGLDRYHQSAISNMSVGLRLLGDERDEALNLYDSLVQVFDLEPPQGFSSMEDFNAELCASLDKMHPGMRAHLNQTLRSGTQTQGHLFGSGQLLVDKIQARIDEALQRYVAGLKQDENHPFLSRRGGAVRYAGSWSSRLMDCGFHVNHIHPRGWISSCYYAGVPEAVKDEKARQGWIKFGESGFIQLGEKNPPPRRAVQPVPGRLVLFPSYMWHGTVPFHGPTPRTTIAFDVVPA
jgi:tetratricopeptide (TPR) repeat protein